MADTFSNKPSFFDSFTTQAATDLMSLQLAAGQPEVVSGIVHASDPLVPDRHSGDRLAHFDPELYDLRDTSHLIKLLKALLGSAGVGGLRKQMSVARMQNTFRGMHFLDLDRFYGALFGVMRTHAEVAPDFAFNPYTGATDADSWDDLHSRDASYRSRLIKFVHAIPYGGSFLGMKTMAEALVGAECDLYESFDWHYQEQMSLAPLSAQGNPLVYTWGFLRTQVGTWGGMDKRTWGDWGGGRTPFADRTGVATSAEWVIHPKRPLAEDEKYELVRVLSRFKPAGTSFTVNNSGLSIHAPVALRGVAASSEYWEVTSSVLPQANLQFNPYTNLPGQVVIPARRPAFAQYQGESWSHNGSIVSATSYTLDNGRAVNDDELVVYTDGTSHSYQASDALLPAALADAARLASDGVLTSAPYAPGRAVLNPTTVAVSS